MRSVIYDHAGDLDAVARVVLTEEPQAGRPGHAIVKVLTALALALARRAPELFSIAATFGIDDTHAAITAARAAGKRGTVLLDPTR
jgi:hypothetical protein